MLVLLARSVSVAAAIMPINMTSKISFEKFIFSLSFAKIFEKRLKTSKKLFWWFSFALYNSISSQIYI